MVSRRCAPSEDRCGVSWRLVLLVGLVAFLALASHLRNFEVSLPGDKTGPEVACSHSDVPSGLPSLRIQDDSQTRDTAVIESTDRDDRPSRLTRR